MSVKKIKISFTINGDEKIVCTYPMKRLIDVLREDILLTGTKEGCGEGECGACAVLINGELVDSCLVPAIQIDGCELTTIEGIASEDDLDIVQDAFINNNGAQCGICTPGMILASSSLLMKNPKPNNDEIKKHLAGNLCRCTGYTKIYDSVKEASNLMGKK